MGCVSRIEPTINISQDLVFFGDTRIHPAVFIKKLKKYIETLPSSMNIKNIISSTMKGDADIWYQLIEDKYDTFDEFEQLFISKYWGEYHQQKVRINLINGKYNEKFGSSRERYLMKKIYNIKHLEPKFTENEMVKMLARHFEEDIHKVIVTQRISTIDGLIDYIRSIDDYQTGWKKNENRQDNRIPNGNGQERRQNEYRNNQERSNDNRQENRNQNNRGNNTYSNRFNKFNRKPENPSQNTQIPQSTSYNNTIKTQAIQPQNTTTQEVNTVQTVAQIHSADDTNF
ncbi:putative mediator of RNA polymerase II transcription subunit 29 [Anoplophora glabripennis]|uniref:putative mediator of RNA polymerase II transcription subunit 29 n=1 Tax=Anoplophora glabripennis TaxID=217634 RepID=UPI000C77D878|nr:putative mediator of RNA polymerase II transcription subunit 29 [Anoplophora glabripennis]